MDETKPDLASDTDLLSVLINTFLNNSLDLFSINGFSARVQIFKSRQKIKVAIGMKGDEYWAVVVIIKIGLQGQVNFFAI